MPVTTPFHTVRGWWRDHVNDRLAAVYEGTEVFRINASGLSTPDGKITNSVVQGAGLASGVLKVNLLAGQNGGVDATYDVTGAAVGDEVVFVGHLTTAAAIATLADVTADFSFTAAAVLTDGGPTDYSNDQLLLIWIDHT